MGVNWNDPKSVDAIRAYVRMAVGLAFVAVLLYMMATGHIDPVAVLKAITSLLAVGRLADGALLLLSKNAGNN